MTEAKEPIEPFVALEFFAGVHAIASAFSKHGHHTMAFDILRDPSHDLNQCVGLTMGLISVLHLPCGSLAHFAVVCTSFCWINSATHGRSMSFPLGDVQRQYVQEGTALAFSTVTCMTYIHVTCVFATNTLCIVRSQGCSLLDCVATWMCPHSGAASQQPPCLSSSSSMVDPVAFQYASQPQIWPLGCHKFG